MFTAATLDRSTNYAVRRRPARALQLSICARGRALARTRVNMGELNGTPGPHRLLSFTTPFSRPALGVVAGIAQFVFLTVHNCAALLVTSPLRRCRQGCWATAGGAPSLSLSLRIPTGCRRVESDSCFTCARRLYGWQAEGDPPPAALRRRVPAIWPYFILFFETVRSCFRHLVSAMLARPLVIAVRTLATSPCAAKVSAPAVHLIISLSVEALVTLVV